VTSHRHPKKPPRGLQKKKDEDNSRGLVARAALFQNTARGTGTRRVSGGLFLVGVVTSCKVFARKYQIKKGGETKHRGNGNGRRRVAHHVATSWSKVSGSGSYQKAFPRSSRLRRQKEKNGADRGWGKGSGERGKVRGGKK